MSKSGSLEETYVLIEFNRPCAFGLIELRFNYWFDDRISADDLLISGVLIKERTLDVKQGSLWLGDDGPSEEEKAVVPEHDFAIVTFSYFYNLGRLGLLDYPCRLLTSSPSVELGNARTVAGRERSLSRIQSTPVNLCVTSMTLLRRFLQLVIQNSSRALVAEFDDHLTNKIVIKNRTVRRELRKQQRIFSERICEV
ncbi:unnamed protein product [Arabis nemorensis]|uniref:Uncharacterized protein n=1 Tax=Arabis nemorensis TaxID=586526 RepID=A0A565BJ80_9BRAS|nr:unnamed protein product [Arabis nemorensis]